MKILRRVGLLVALVLMMVPFAYAEQPQVSEILAKKLYCDTSDLLQGNIGLLIGFILMFFALWSLIYGAKLIVVAPLIVIGAIVTALPTIVEQSFIGLGNLLNDADISSTTFLTPTCDSLEDQIDAQMKSRATGTYYPGRGTYSAPSDSGSSGACTGGSC